MLRKLAIIALLCASAFGQTNGFRPDIVQSNVAVDPGSGQIIYWDNVTSGNLEAGCATWFDAGLTLSVADSLSTSYILTSVLTGSGPVYVQCWHGVAPSTGSNTVTLTGLTGHHNNDAIGEFANISGMLDTTTTVSTNSSPSSLTVSPTTTVNGDLIIAFAGPSDRTSMQFYAAYPQQFAAGTGGGVAGPVLMNFEDAGLAGSQSLTVVPNVFAQGTPVRWNILAMAFKPSGIAVTASALPHCAQTTACSMQLTAVGGTGAYTWAATGLPANGYSLNTSTGVISAATPGSVGCFNIGVTVTDGVITSATRTLAVCTGASFGTISNIQSATGGGTGTVTLPGVSSGHLVFVRSWGPENFGQNNWVWNTTAGTHGYISDSLGTTFLPVRPVTSVTGAAGNGAPTVTWVGCTTAAGSDTITSTAGFALEAEEWAGGQSVIDDGTLGALAGAASSPLNVTTSNYTAQVANETLLAGVTAGTTSPSTIGLTSPLVTIFNGNPGGTNLLLASGYVNETSAGTYTVNATTSTTQPTGDAISIQLIGLRPEIAGLGCSGIPVNSAKFVHRVIETQ